MRQDKRNVSGQSREYRMEVRSSDTVLLRGGGQAFSRVIISFGFLELLGVSGSPIYNLLAGCCSMFSSKLYSNDTG